MKKFFFKRHCLFFITLLILIICQVLILKHCFSAYNNRVIRDESVAALAKTLNAKQAQLPRNYLETEQQMRAEVTRYRKFIAETWQKMLKLSSMTDFSSIPSNHVATFFAISNYLTWARESCDSLGVEFESACSFGFRGAFERNEQPLSTEIFGIHRQKEQLKLLISYLLESRSSYLKIISVERGDDDDTRSAYFDNSDMFLSDVRQVDGTESHVYKITFTTFTNTFRNFLRNLYENEVPVIFRQISVQPNYTFKLTKSNREQISDCLASTFTLVVEFLDVPQSLSQYNKKNAAIYRKILYGTTP